MRARVSGPRLGHNRAVPVSRKTPPSLPAETKSDRLSRRQVDLVLRRAADLEAQRRDGGGREEDQDHLSPDDLLRLGEEAGLSPESVGRALAEVRHGSFLEAEPPGGLADLVGPKRLAIARHVPAGVEQSERAIERYMQQQLMIVRRHHGERVEWEKAKGLWPGLARSLDFARRYTFGPIERVETMVMPDEHGTSSVAFRVDLNELRRTGVSRMAVRAVVPMLMAAGMASVASSMPDAAVMMSVGAASAAALVVRERRRLTRMRESVSLGVERFLDLMVARRRRDARKLGAGSLMAALLPPDPEADDDDRDGLARPANTGARDDDAHDVGDGSDKR